MKPLRITYFLRDDGACGYYRVDLPIRKLVENGVAKSMRIDPWASTDKVEASFNADLLVMPRVCEPAFLEIMAEVQLQGKYVVVDHDDDMFSISPYSPHYQEWGCENVCVTLEDGKQLELWKDGDNINLLENRDRIDTVKRACEKANMVTVTQEHLARAYRPYNDNVVCLPNCLEPKLWERLPLKPNERLRLFWAGGSSHFHDWKMMESVWPELFSRYPGKLQLVIMGHTFERTVAGVPKDALETHTWCPTPAYPYKARILNPDIGVIPLEDTAFNRAKSCIKLVEFSALSTPCAVSHVTPFKEAYNGANAVMVENDHDCWVEALSALIEDPLLRVRIAEEAHAYSLRHFDINTQWRQWEDAYRACIEGGKVTSEGCSDNRATSNQTVLEEVGK